MDKFYALREESASSRYREHYNDVVYEELVHPGRFANAWKSSASDNEIANDINEIESEYASFGECDSEHDGDLLFKNCQNKNSVYEDMTFDPAPDTEDEMDPIKLKHDSSKRNSLTRSVIERPSADLSGTPPLYRALLNRLSVSQSSLRKSKSLPRDSISPSRSSPVLNRKFVVETESVPIPYRDQNVLNPLYTPSPGGSPCGSPSSNNVLSQRLANQSQPAVLTDDEDIYNTPTRFADKPPVLPPKMKSLSVKLQNRIKLDRSISLDSQIIQLQKKERQRQTSLGDRDEKVGLASVECPLEDDLQFVGSLIEHSSKSDELEKRLSRKSKKKRVEEVEKRSKKKEEVRKEESKKKEDDILRSSSLALSSMVLALRDDWDEIDSMMLDLQCDISQTQKTIRRPTDTAPNTNKSLEIWLKTIDLQEIQTMMELNGWDNIVYLNGTIVKEDLVTMGINNEKIKRKLLKSVEEELVNFTHHSIPGTVEEWLTSIELSRYLNKFNYNRMGSMNRVLEIWEVELTSILNIEPIGHRKRIMKSIRALRTLQSSAEKKKKDKGGPKWFHKKSDLVRGVDYAVKYYGCAKIEGPESSKQTSTICQKQQSKMSSNQKLPEYRLRISAAGIEFIDKQTHKLTCKYAIEDISFVSREKDDLLLFSFISSDRNLNMKLCHVFKAHTRNQAFETCSTIAQAFEVAYQVRDEAKKL